MNLDLAGDREADLHAGLVALVVTVVELLVEVMEAEAVRRMESGDLTDAEVERLGKQLHRLEEELARLKAEQDVQAEVAEIKDDLDSVLRAALSNVDRRSADTGVPFEP